MEFLDIRRDFQRPVLERNHKEASPLARVGSRSAELELDPMRGRVEMIQMIAGSGLASSGLSLTQAESYIHRKKD
jgi:hypothetical protein